MPPQLALLLCTAFVWYMLRFDRELSRDVSHAVWLPTLWVFSITTKPLAHWLAHTGGDEWTSPWDQRFQVALLVVGLAVVARRSFDWAGVIRRHLWLFLLVGYMLASSCWSDMPFTSFKRWMRQLVGIMMAFVILSEVAPHLAVKSILRRVAYVLMPFSIVLIKYFPHYGVEFHRWSGERMWVGVSTQKNGLAIVCIISLLFLLWVLIRRWQQCDRPVNRYHALGESLVLVLGLYMLLLPDGKASSTSIAACTLGVSSLLGFCCPLARRARIGGHLVTVSVIALVVLGMGLPFAGKGLNSGLASAMGRDETLTGRADTWAELVPIAMRHPVFGCGFGSYWTPDTRDLHGMSHAHNAYLEIFNELGALGFLLFTLFWLSLARAAVQASVWDGDWTALSVGYLLMALLHGAAESTINSFTGQLGGPLLLLLVSCTGLARQARVTPEAAEKVISDHFTDEQVLSVHLQRETSEIRSRRSGCDPVD